MDPLQVLKLMDMAITIATGIGINIQKYQAMREKADSEGRDISTDELESLLKDSQKAINSLQEEIDARR